MNKEKTNFTDEEVSSFEKFAFKDRMVDVAVAFIIGAAFQKAVTALSNNLMMPVLNFFVAQTGSNWRKLVWTPIEGMTIEIGQCVGSFLDFLLISGLLYLIYVKLLRPFLVSEQVTQIKKESNKCCPFCASQIPIVAKRCGQCTSWLEGEGEAV